MPRLAQPLLDDLVTANRILAHQEIVDAFGHVSVRDPGDAGIFYLSRSLSPALVTGQDILSFDLDGRPTEEGPAPYLERFIHGAIYKRRQDVGAVVHCHAPAFVSFGIAGTPLRPATHVSAAMGAQAPIWDIADRFGDTNLLVTCNAQADDLAEALGRGAAVLMRGHGATIVGPDLRAAVLTTIYASINARIILDAGGVGAVHHLSAGEVEHARESLLGPTAAARAWEYFAGLAGR